jgi:hypothetical protein
MTYFFFMKIVHTRRYLKDMKRIGASASEITTLEATIATSPAAGDVIPGLAGLRKYRFRLAGRA